MAEYWKSTPSHYCKYCSTFVRDTPLERKNHDASIKHQNNIQKSLRQLTQGKERQEREKQRARDEVARLNGLVGGKQSPVAGKNGGIGTKPMISGLTHVGGGSNGQVSRTRTAAERKAHAEQLAALGVELPEELKKEVTGVGSWTTVPETVIDEQQHAPATLAGTKSEEDGKDDVKMALSRGVRKPKPQEDEDAEEGETRKGWGNRQRRYPGREEEGVGEDLDLLLSGVVPRKREATENGDAKVEVKKEDSAEDAGVLGTGDAGGGKGREEVKKEDAGAEDEAVPAVVFKKRKVKK